MLSFVVGRLRAMWWKAGMIFASIMAMLQIVRVGWMMGVAVLVFGGAPAAQAAARNPRDTKTSPTPAPSRTPKKASIARNPYVGAIAVDAANGRVLFEDQADAKSYPASVLKLMDLLIILERIDKGQLSFQDPVPVSAKASKTGGSQVWLAEKESFPVDEMLYALMVMSANDAAVALAEKIASTADAFLALMNQRARELGMGSTVFHSVHGLPPGPGQEHDVTTARDLAVLCRVLLKHPDALRYTSTRVRPFRPNGGKKMVELRTHNHLLGQVEGCDGFKTGYFAEAGYSTAVTAARQGQRVIAIVLGSLDRKVRDAKAAELLARGFMALPVASAPVPRSVPTGGRSSARTK